MARRPKDEPTNEQRVRTLLAGLRKRGELDELYEALGALAVTLAKQLDEGAGMATAAVSKELRATLAQLTAKEIDGDIDEDIFGADLGVAPLSAKVLHGSKPRAPHHRAPRRGGR